MVAAFKTKGNTAKLVLSGFVDPSGDAAKNAELAKLRAFAVRDALKAAGVAERQNRAEKPEDLTAGATSAAEGRRVDHAAVTAITVTPKAAFGRPFLLINHSGQRRASTLALT